MGKNDYKLKVLTFILESAPIYNEQAMHNVKCVLFPLVFWTLLPAQQNMVLSLSLPLAFSSSLFF